jgi:hypothetical protein
MFNWNFSPRSNVQICVDHFKIGVVERVVQDTPFLVIAVCDNNGVPLGQLVAQSTVPQRQIEGQQEQLLLRGM